jgi:cytochrome oxidase assembly protein ShyY1
LKDVIVMPISFRFRWIPFIASLLVAALGASLGTWQVSRAHEKEAIEAKLQARSAAPPVSLNAGNQDVAQIEFRRATARGLFVRDWPLYLDNRPYNGAAGFYVLMPFRLEGSGHTIMVARGWVQRDPGDRTKLPPLRTPEGVIEIQGMVKRDAGHILQLGAQSPPQPGAIMQNLEFAAFKAASGMTLEALVLEQTSDSDDGLVRDWPRPSTGLERHWGYAFQWYALAATAIIFFIVTGFRRGTKQA